MKCNEILHIFSNHILSSSLCYFCCCVTWNTYQNEGNCGSAKQCCHCHLIFFALDCRLPCWYEVSNSMFAVGWVYFGATLAPNLPTWRFLSCFDLGVIRCRKQRKLSENQFAECKEYKPTLAYKCECRQTSLTLPNVGNICIHWILWDLKKTHRIFLQEFPSTKGVVTSVLYRSGQVVHDKLSGFISLYYTPICYLKF